MNYFNSIRNKIKETNEHIFLTIKRGQCQWDFDNIKMNKTHFNPYVHKYCLQIESNPSKYHLPVFFRVSEIRAFQFN